MISERAKSGFDQLVQAALKGGLATTGSSSCRIEPIATLEKAKEKKIAILTVSSYLFRLITIIYFKDDPTTRAFFAGAAEDGTPRSLGEQEFLDRISECGNICCGSLNRDLGRYFPHVGMSTPNIIDRDCMRYVDLLGAGLLRHYKLEVSEGLTMYASLCVTDYGTVDFQAEAAKEEDLSTGELEFF